MPGTLIYAEVQKGEIKKGAFEINKQGQGIGRRSQRMRHRQGRRGCSAAACKFGADRFTWSTGPSFENYIPEAFVQAFVQVAQKVQPAVIFCSASAQGKDFAPAMAARLNVGTISDCVGVTKEGDKIVAKRHVVCRQGLCHG